MEQAPLSSWVDIAPDSDFSIHNLPYGIFSLKKGMKKAGVALGNYLVDLAGLDYWGYLTDLGLPEGIFYQDDLNEFIGLGETAWKATRQRIQQLLSTSNEELRDDAHKILIPRKEAELHLPIKIPNYTDFYSSEEHARNVGSMFRDPERALLPNWKHLPVAYHGRASSIVISGTDIYRPSGQILVEGQNQPSFQASRQLDFELEMAFVVGKENPLGQPVSVQEAHQHIFGLMLFNDWSARDIQRWEYVPLGPFLGKSFASSVSPWIVTMEALEPFRVKGPAQDPDVLDYLKFQGEHNYDIQLEVGLAPQQAPETVISRSNTKYLYWNIQQQLAHHTVNGCNLQVGDVCASGTISGSSPSSYGSMLELSWQGTRPVTLQDGSTRTFLQDYDTVSMRAYATSGGLRVGFGEVRNTILPPR